MRDQLIELTPESPALCSALSWNSDFTIAWQSSNTPSMATTRTLSSSGVVMNSRCTSEMRPCG